jgi:hypothetical protein
MMLSVDFATNRKSIFQNMEIVFAENLASKTGKIWKKGISCPALRD